MTIIVKNLSLPHLALLSLYHVHYFFSLYHVYIGKFILNKLLAPATSYQLNQARSKLEVNFLYHDQSAEFKLENYLNFYFTPKEVEIRLTSLKLYFENKNIVNILKYFH